MDEELADFIGDTRNDDPTSIRAWKKNQDMKHYDAMVAKHGKDNVRLCDICWRGIHKARAKELKGSRGKNYIGPICWKRHRDALKSVVKASVRTSMKLKIKDGRAQIQAAKLATADELAKALESTIKKHFPKSMVTVSVQNSLGPGKNIYLFFAVAGSKSEVANSIWENDISLTKVLIYGIDDQGNLKDKLEFDPAMGGSILVRPEPGSYMAYDSVKVGLRKKKGTPEQIVKHVDTYFKKLSKAIKDNAENIPDGHKKLLKSIKF